MAFGAGALLFAVAIEMFAAGLRELDEGESQNHMTVLIIFSVIGAIFYIVVNRILTAGASNSVSASAKKEAGLLEEYSTVSKGTGEEDGEEAEGKPPNNVAFSIWLGILIDGIPESMLIGFMQSEGKLSIAFIIAVFLANFPEAMSSASIMFRNGDSAAKIMCMWSALFLGTGVIAFLTALIFPGECRTNELGETVCSFPSSVGILAVASEGLAGGSMMACISTAMLPEAFESGGDFAGLLTLLGFLASLFVKLTLEKRHTHEFDHGQCAGVGGFHEHSASGVANHFMEPYPQDETIYME